MVVLSCKQQCPIRTPAEYQESLKKQKDTLAYIKQQVTSVLANNSNSNNNNNNTNASSTQQSAEERKRKQTAASTALSKKFMEWMVSTGNAKQVLDLVR